MCLSLGSLETLLKRSKQAESSVQHPGAAAVQQNPKAMVAERVDPTVYRRGIGGSNVLVNQLCLIFSWVCTQLMQESYHVKLGPVLKMVHSDLFWLPKKSYAWVMHKQCYLSACQAPLVLMESKDSCVSTTSTIYWKCAFVLVKAVMLKVV